MKKEKYTDPFLEKRRIKYEEWLGKGLISHPSRVIPISEALNTKPWVLPTEQGAEILRNATSIAVQACECRVHYKRCDNPLDVCLLLDGVADAFVLKGEARHVDLTEACTILKEANACGLVHLALYMPDHEIYALCSCCSCCCHDLQMMALSGQRNLVAYSEYVAITDIEGCTHCGGCVDVCVFGARVFCGGAMAYKEDACLGCGLCVTRCPVGAISLEMRKEEPPV